MLAARVLGYGTIYGTDFITAPAQRAAIEIPDRYEIICTIALGVPEQCPEPPEKKDLESLIVRERFEERAAPPPGSQGRAIDAQVSTPARTDLPCLT